MSRVVNLLRKVDDDSSSCSDSDDENVEVGKEPKNEKSGRLFKFVDFEVCKNPFKMAENPEPLFIIDREAQISDHEVEEKLQLANNSEKVEKTMPFQNNEPDKTMPLDSTADLDDHLKKLISKSVFKPDFEKIPGEGHVRMSKRAAKRQRKMEREKTKGGDWYNLPATEMTSELRKDLKLIQMRDSLDPKTHYRKNDRRVLPKYFQVGTIAESKTDFYSSRIPKKQRKRTIVEELLDDMDFQSRQRKKYQEIKAAQANTKRGAFQHSYYRRKKHKRGSHKV